MEEFIIIFFFIRESENTVHIFLLAIYINLIKNKLKSWQNETQIMKMNSINQYF